MAKLAVVPQQQVPPADVFPALAKATIDAARVDRWPTRTDIDPESFLKLR